MTQNQNEGSINDEDGKLFIGGLSWETSQEKLQEYFGQYGEVIDVVVMKNKETGRSRGFGFVTFKDSTCVAKVLSISPHELDGRTIDPKVCSSRGAQKGKKSGSFPKVFLGGLPPTCTETDIRSFFSRYGNVMEVVLMYDQEKKKARGFGFLSFETEDSVKQVCAEHYVKINGKQVECKHAEPRDKNSRQQQAPQNQWGGPNMGPGWGPPPPGGPGPMGPGGPMPGPMGGPYQGGWGGPQQPGPYGPQGGWGSQQQGYGPGYQNWGGPGWGGPAPQYGQGYGGYGPGYGGGGGGNYGGYNGPPPPGGPPSGPPGGGGGQPPASDGYLGPGQTPAAGPGGPPPAGQGPPGNHSGTYAQENSNYGPARGYGSGGGGSGGGGGGGYNNGPSSYGGPTGNYNNNTGSYGAQGSYNSGDSNPPPTSSRTVGQGQGYHPYRR